MKVKVDTDNLHFYSLKIYLDKFTRQQIINLGILKSIVVEGELEDKRTNLGTVKVVFKEEEKDKEER